MLAALLAALAVATAPPPTHRAPAAAPAPLPAPALFSQVRVWFRIDSVNMVTGVTKCFDPGFLNCSRPEFFVRLTASDGRVITTDAVVNRENVVWGRNAPANWEVAPFQVTRPASLNIAVFDADGGETDANGDGSIQDELRSAAQPADVRMGPGVDLTLDLEPLIGGRTTQMRFVGEDARITFTIGVEIVPGTVGPVSTIPAFADFRPSGGEQLRMLVGGSGGPRLAFTVYGNTGIVRRLDAQMPATPPGVGTQVEVAWDGRDTNGQVVPPGNYRITIEGFAPGPIPAGRTRTIPEAVTVAATVRAPDSALTLRLVAFEPGPQWAPETGDLVARVIANRSASLNADVLVGSTCVGTAPVVQALGMRPLAPSTEARVAWNGATPSGAPIAPGAYALRLTASATGAVPQEICRPFSVVAALPPLVWVRHTPFLAQPGDVVTLEARAVDSAGRPRRVPRLVVSGETTVLGQPRPTAPPPPLLTCTNTDRCSATITMPGSAAMFAWQGEAQRADNATLASSGWRGQRVTDWAGFTGLPGATAIAVDQALPGPLSLFVPSEPSRGFDLVFNVSNSFSWASADDRAQISTALDGILQRTFGLVGTGAPSFSTFLARQDLLRLYLVPELTQVTWNPPGGLCEWSTPSVAWADARGVLHRTSCRDNAYFFTRNFSARLAAWDVVLHEVHHALFGLADEYAPDGGYSPSAELPNVFATLADCVAVAGRPPTGCGMITEMKGTPLRNTGRTFFRVDDQDPNDIMQSNGAQRFSDIRQARFREAQCARANC